MTRLAPSLASAVLVLAHTTPAQSVIGESCQHTDLTYYGAAVAFAGDLDGDGGEDLLIGGPLESSHGVFPNGEGALYVNSTLVLPGEDDGDRFGAAVAAGLDLDGVLAGDLLVGAPGDDDLGEDCGSVTALSSEIAFLHRAFGSGEGDAFGTSLARVGDLDGDGLDEYLVGAPQTGNGGPGYARVVSGATGTELRVHLGQAAGDRFGRGVTGLGDVDGDGHPDYAIGAPGEVGTGRVRIYSGRTGLALRVLDGLLPDGEFGFALGTGSDVDRNGHKDLVVGAPHEVAGPGAGTVRVIAMPSGQELLVIEATSTDHRFGAAVAGAGDFDGDGTGDVVVGAPGPFFMDFPTAPGSVSVFSGTGSGLLARVGGGSSGGGVGLAVAGGHDVNKDGLGNVIVGGAALNDGYGASSCIKVLADDRNERILRETSAAALGFSVARVADLDGDGLGEVLIGAPEARAPSGLRTGSARVETANGEVLFEFFGSFDGDRLGQAVADAGDMDGDGVTDLAIGSASDRPAFVPPGVGRVEVYSGATGALLHVLPGNGTPAFGGRIAGGGDLDGDGRDDLVVGGPRFAVNQGNLTGFQDAGHVRVFSGRTGGVLYTLDGSNDEALGASVAVLEDVNGDGRPDFAVGIPRRYTGPPQFAIGVVDLHSGADGSLIGTYAHDYLYIGVSLATVDDLDGDGVGDLMIGAWDPQALISYGSIHVISTNTLELLWMVEESTGYEGLSFGFALDRSGDHDGDGLDDIVLGMPGTNRPSARAVGSAQVRSLQDGALLATYEGYSGWDYFGYSVAGLGDIDGDGAPDLALGAPTEANNSQGAEPGQDRVHLVLSNRLVHHEYCPWSVHSGGVSADLTANGSSRVSQNDLQLEVTDLPLSGVGAFLMGTESIQLPFSSGHRCLGGQVQRLSAPRSTAAGALDMGLDLTSPLGSLLVPGASMSFQFWFRDLGSTNTSDAVRIDFVP